ADLGIGGNRGRAHRIGVELHELAKAAGARLLVAEHPSLAIAAIGLRQLLEILRHVARERRGQVVAQREPLLVVVLEREHTLVRPVLVGQKLSQRIGIFDRRRLQRLEAIALVDPANLLEHTPRSGNLGAAAIGKPARQARLELVGFIGLVGHYCPALPAGGSSQLTQRQGTQDPIAAARSSASAKTTATETAPWQRHRHSAQPPSPTTSKPFGFRSRPIARSRRRRASSPAPRICITTRRKAAPCS